MKARTRSRASRIWGVIASSCMAASTGRSSCWPYAASCGPMRGDGAAMHVVENGVLLIVVVAAGTVAARRLRLEPSILLVLVGVALSLIPGVPSFRLDPEVVLVLILPPLLYAAAFRTSVPAFRANLRPILLLAVALTLFSTVVVGLVAHAVVPGLPLAAALALGAILAPPDAVSATAVARRTGLPRRIVTVLEGESLLNDATALVAYRVAVAAAVVGVRFAWMFPAAYGTRLLARSRGAAAPRSWREPLVVSWAGMRGVVSLAAAFALPLTVRSGAPFPQRDLLLFLTFVIIGVTLVGQGVTMPALIRRLAIPGPDPTTDALQEASAQQQAASAALERLEALLRSERVPPPGVAEQLRQRAEGRTLAVWERLGSPSTGAEGFPTPSAAYRRLRREMLAAEREVLVRLRDNGRLDEEVQRRIQWELDLEEATLLRE